MYTIRYQPQDNVLFFSLHGFWTLDTAHAFRAELFETVQQILNKTATFDIFTDASDFVVQSADVVAAFTEVQKRLSTMNGGRQAIVVKTSLNKLQAERPISNDATRVFLTKDEAMAWLKTR